MGKIKSYFTAEIEDAYEASEPERSMAESQISDDDSEAPDEEIVTND